MATVADIAGLLGRYRVLAKALDEARFNHFRRAFRSLGAGVGSLMEMSRQLERQQASGRQQPRCGPGPSRACKSGGLWATIQH